MSNGQQCCALDLPCCKPPGNPRGAVAKMVHDCSVLGYEQSFVVADAILAEYDLVPKGVGTAIVKGYAPWMVTESPSTAVSG